MSRAAQQPRLRGRRPLTLRGSAARIGLRVAPSAAAVGAALGRRQPHPPRRQPPEPRRRRPRGQPARPERPKRGQTQPTPPDDGARQPRRKPRARRVPLAKSMGAGGAAICRGASGPRRRISGDGKTQPRRAPPFAASRPAAADVAPGRERTFRGRAHRRTERRAASRW